MKKIHKGWIMSVLISLVMIIGVGLYSSTSSVFMKAICDGAGFPRGEYSFARTVITLVGIVTVPFLRKLLDKIGTKKTLIICSIGIAATTAAFAVATSMLHFYIICALQGIFNMGVSLFVAANYIRKWFNDSLGLATSIAYSGTGLGGAIFSPACTALIESVGWRMTYIIISAAGILVLIPLIVFGLKESPEKIGIKPYEKTDKQENHKEKLVNRPSDKYYSMRDVKRMVSFYILLGVYIMVSLVNNGPWAHTTAFLSDNGFTAMQATTMNSFYLVCLTAGKLVIGVMYDKLGKKITGLCWMAALIIEPVAALMIDVPLCPWIYCICLGFVGGGFTVGMNLILGMEFGQRAFGDTLSIFTMVTSLSGAAASPMMGAIFDMTGSYRLAFIILLVCSVLASLGFGYVTFKKDKKESVSVS